MTFNACTQSAIIITCPLSDLFIESVLVGSFKHLPDSRDTQITAYLCMQLASKSSSLILCIIHGSLQPISLSLMVLKTCKIQRENILKRPIGSVIQENYNFDSTSPQLPFHINLFHIYILFFKIQRCFFIIILDFVTLGFLILFSSDNKSLRPSKPPRFETQLKMLQC